MGYTMHGGGTPASIGQTDDAADGEAVAVERRR
jgi:hypothetical protein